MNELSIYDTMIYHQGLYECMATLDPNLYYDIEELKKASLYKLREKRKELIKEPFRNCFLCEFANGVCSKCPCFKTSYVEETPCISESSPYKKLINIIVERYEYGKINTKDFKKACIDVSKLEVLEEQRKKMVGGIL